MRYIVRSVCGDRVSSHRTLDGAARAKSKNPRSAVFAVHDGYEFAVPLVIGPPAYFIESAWWVGAPLDVRSLVEAEAPSVR